MRPQLNPRTHPAMFVKSACILAGLVAFWFGAFFAFPDSFAVRAAALRRCRSLTCPDSLYPASQASLLCAALLGAMKAEIGVSIMHDANHGAYSRSTLFGRVMGATLDVAGASRCVRRLPRASRISSC